MGFEIKTTSKGIGAAKGEVHFGGEIPRLDFSVFSEMRLPLTLRIMSAQECDMGGCMLPERAELGRLKGVTVTFKDIDGHEYVGEPEDESFIELRGAVIQAVKFGTTCFTGLETPTMKIK